MKPVVLNIITGFENISDYVVDHKLRLVLFGKKSK